jgi:hypothetical protein
MGLVIVRRGKTGDDVGASFRGERKEVPQVTHLLPRQVLFMREVEEEDRGCTGEF